MYWRWSSAAGNARERRSSDMKLVRNQKASSRIAGWAKGLLLCLLLPNLGVYAETWQGYAHYEYSGPWHWKEFNCRTVQTPTGYKEICDIIITGYSGSVTDLYIPDKINLHVAVVGGAGGDVSWDYEGTVKGIGGSAFYNSGLTSITIRDGVEFIEDGNDRDYYDYKGAFKSCSALERVSIPNSMTNIGAHAFSDCSGLTSVTIPNSVTSIGKCAFSGCSGLTSVTLPNALKRIEGGTFYYCRGLTTLVIPNSVVDICDSVGGYEASSYGAFSACDGLTSVTIPNSVTNIGSGAFSGCSGLTSVTIPDSVTIIGQNAFYYCSNLASVNIGSGVKDIDDRAFSGCSGIKSVTVPQYVLDGYFSGRDYDYYFSGYGVSGLFHSARGNITSVSFSSVITNIGQSAFYNCSGLTSVTIPDSVKNIGGSAFYGCSNLASVNIGNGVKSIGQNAFYNCSSLRDVYLSDVAAWCGVAFESSSASPFYYAGNLYLNGALVTALDIPDGVTGISDYAFYKCDCLQSVSIPDSVTSIGGSAFYNCSGLMSVTIGNSVTSIGGSAFANCSGLTSVTIPNSVTSIGGSAFFNCSGLTSVTICNGVTSIGYEAFYSCGNIISATVPQSVMSLGLASVFNNSYQKLRSLRLGANVTNIGADEFNNCRALTSVTVADGNTSYVVLADGCLYDIARNLLLFCPRDKASITIPNGVTSIGNYAFQYCTNLVSASMPETMRSIGTYSFYGCPKISGLMIPNSVQTLSTTAFDGCEVLWTEWYRALANLSVSGGGSSGGGSVEPVDPRYVLAASPADRAIASVTVNGDCSIDQFVLTDGKVYDTVLRIVNTSANEVHLTLPSGYTYETFRGARPLTIPANSRNMLTITRTAADTFLVSREVLETVQ